MRGNPLAQAAYEDDPFIGRCFGKCRIDSKIAVGGYGVVYKATDVNLGVPRAVKFFHPHLSGEKGFRERFLNEMKLLARMDHPNIVKIVVSIEEEDVSGFVMEFVPGRDLADTLDEAGRLEFGKARDIFLQIGGAIDYAHTMDPPVIHRDLSPDNAMIKPDGSVKIMDFGISKTINAERLTQTGIVLGKPMYMAPEQFEGQVTVACDQFALGVIFYEMLVGDVPFEGETPIAQYRARFRQEVTIPPDVKKQVPGEIVEAILRATRRDPKERFDSVGGFVAAIEATARPAPRSGTVSIPAPKVGAKSGSEVDALLDEARVKIGLHRYREALLDIERILATKPDCKPALDLREECRRQMESREAQRAIENAYRQALACHKKGDVDAAREQLEVFIACLERLPKSKIHDKYRKDLAKAMPDLVEEVESIEKERRETVKDLLKEARQLYRTKHFGEAAEALEELLQFAPDNAEAKELLGHCRQGARRDGIVDRLKEGLAKLRGEDFAGALAEFDAVLASDPEHSEALRYRDLAQAQVDEQNAEAERAQVRQSEVEHALEDGRRFFRNWEYPDAIRCFRMVLSLDGGNLEAQRLLDEARHRMEDVDKVEEIGFLYNEGITFYQNRRFAEAIRCFDKVLAHFQQHKGAVKYRELAAEALASDERIAELNRSGIEEYRNQRYPEALAAFQEVLGIDRANRVARKYAVLCQEMVNVQDTP